MLSLITDAKDFAVGTVRGTLVNSANWAGKLGRWGMYGGIAAFALSGLGAFYPLIGGPILGAVTGALAGGAIGLLTGGIAEVMAGHRERAVARGQMENQAPQKISGWEARQQAFQQEMNEKLMARHRAAIIKAAEEKMAEKAAEQPNPPPSVPSLGKREFTQPSVPQIGSRVVGPWTQHISDEHSAKLDRIEPIGARR